MANYADQADNIRRIAKQSKLKGALDAAAERDPIEGKVTPFINGTFSQTSTGGSSGDGTGGSTTANGSTTQDNTLPIDPTNPMTFNRGGGGSSSTSETTETTGTQDIESVIDGDAGAQTTDDSTTNYSNPTRQSIQGLTGATDCSTGQCINFRMDGNFPPPDGWDDPDTPPVDPTWEQGYYWTVLGGGDAATVTEAAAETIAYGQANLVDFVAGSLEQASEVQWNQNYTYIGGSTSYGIVKVLCADPSYNDTCGLTEGPATETAWPTDGCYDLALIDGGFQSNQYDSEAPDWSREGSSAVDVCFGVGRTATVYATAQGGAMLVETVGGVPTIAKVYASDGTLQEGGDATTQLMNQYLPK